MRILRRVGSFVITLAGAAYLCLIGLAFFADRILFQPQPSSYKDSDFQAGSVSPSTSVDPSLNAGVGSAPGNGRPQVFKLRSEARGVSSASVTALYLPNAQAKYTLLFSHGNAEDVGDDLPILELLHEAGFAVFAYDYRGYGTSEGHSSEKSVYADADAAYNFLTRQLGLPPERVISMGRSLGSAAAIHLAESHAVAGLIVEAPFLSAFRVLTRVPLLPWDKFDNVAKIRLIKVPVLVIHGRADGVVPFWHGARIYREVNAPKQFLWVDRAGHNDILFVAGREYFGALKRFADSIR